MIEQRTTLYFVPQEEHTVARVIGWDRVGNALWPVCIPLESHGGMAIRLPVGDPEGAYFEDFDKAHKAAEYYRITKARKAEADRDRATAAEFGRGLAERLKGKAAEAGQ